MQLPRIAAFTVPLLVLTLASAAPAQDKAKDEGWVSLFNGKDLTGWKLPPQGQFAEVSEKKNGDGKVVALVGKGKDGKDVTLWRVEDGLLIGGGPMTHLYAEPEAEDFHFRVVVKVNDKGNSGLFFRSGFNPGIPKGYEAQVNATHGDKVKTGSLYPNGAFGLDKYGKTFLVLDQAPIKPDEFYMQEVICKGPNVRILVNGKETVNWDDPEHRFKKGHFAVQAHDPGSVMTFKTIEYKPLGK